MTASCCTSQTDSVFTAKTARREIKRYRRKGATGTTKTMLEGLGRLDARGGVLLDIGGGIGVLHHELLDGRFDRAVHVDAAHAYLDIARAEAARRGHGDRVEFRFGDAAAAGEQLPESDLVVLDRVVCCYPDEEALLTVATTKARRWVALSYPRNRLVMRVVVALMNLFERLFRDGFQVFVRPEDQLLDVIIRRGFAAVFDHRSPLWRTTVLQRSSP